jgi:hypothetical protein
MTAYRSSFMILTVAALLLLADLLVQSGHVQRVRPDVPDQGSVNGFRVVLREGDYTCVDLYSDPEFASASCWGPNPNHARAMEPRVENWLRGYPG